MVGKTVLVTTALQPYLDISEGQKLYLGSWCKSTQEESDEFNILPYHWDDRKKLANDYCELNKIYEKLLEEFSTNLNRIHCVSFSTRYWRVIIGPWMGTFLHVLYDRWFMLSKAHQQAINHYISFSNGPESLVSNDTREFMNQITSDKWNDALYSELMSRCWPETHKILRRFSKQQTHNILKKNSSYKIKIFIRGLLRILTKENCHFFYNTYLAKALEIKVQLALLQFPNIWWTTPENKYFEYDYKIRSKFINTNSPGNEFIDVARDFLYKFIPKIFLEGYSETCDLVNSGIWPKSPKSIFTSNEFVMNDFFNIWSAQKVTEGCSLIIGQHGGHFGMSPFSFLEEHQIKIADKWISWGWQDIYRLNVIPYGNIRNISKNRTYNRKGKGLLVQLSIPRYSYSLFALPIAGQYLSYLQDQFQFYKALPENIKEKFEIRLFSQDYGWRSKDQWKKINPKIKFNNQSIGIVDQLPQVRLYVSTYNATTLLESLFWNIPTIAFWDPINSELNREAQYLFDQLKIVGIFHSTPQSAASQTEKVWHDIDDWWQSSEVQEARNMFCEKYSRHPKKPVGLLKKIVLQ
jgi:putative transferase (TIGR04331 family)